MDEWGDEGCNVPSAKCLVIGQTIKLDLVDQMESFSPFSRPFSLKHGDCIN